MGESIYKDAGLSLVLRLAEIYYQGMKDDDKVLDTLPIDAAQHESTCREIARLVQVGSTDEATAYLRNLINPEIDDSIPSHLATLPGYRERAAGNKAVDEELENELLQQALRHAEDLAKAKALHYFQELLGNPTVRFLKQVMSAASDEVLEAVPYIGCGNLSAVRAWAETEGLEQKAADGEGAQEEE